MSDGQEPAGSKQPAENSYKETAKLTYESLLEMRRLSYAAQADYGKWLISSIFLMHGAGIGGLAFKAGATGAPTLSGCDLVVRRWLGAGSGVRVFSMAQL
jgi:hypothetical protein